MKKITFDILSMLIPGFKIKHQPKYTNFGGVEDYSELVRFAKKHPDIQITEELKNKILSKNVISV